MIVTIANSNKCVNFRHSTNEQLRLLGNLGNNKPNCFEYWFKLRTHFYLPIASVKNVTHFVLILGQNTCG